MQYSARPAYSAIPLLRRWCLSILATIFIGGCSDISFQANQHTADRMNVPGSSSPLDGNPNRKLEAERYTKDAKRDKTSGEKPEAKDEKKVQQRINLANAAKELACADLETIRALEPVDIKSRDDLANIENDRNYRLVNDIEIDGLWQPKVISRIVLNGGKYSIKNLKINLPENNKVGLFSEITCAMITDLTLSNVDVLGKSEVGALAGATRNVWVENIRLDEGIVRGKSEIGGLAGVVAYGSTSDYFITIHSNVSVESLESSTAHRGSIVGGLFGAFYGRGYDTHSTGQVIGSQRIGGIAGQMDVDALLAYASFGGKVEAIGHSGGLAGSLDRGALIAFSLFNGEVSGGAGIAGQLDRGSGIFATRSSGVSSNHPIAPLLTRGSSLIDSYADKNSSNSSLGSITKYTDDNTIRRSFWPNHSSQNDVTVYGDMVEYTFEIAKLKTVEVQDLLKEGPWELSPGSDPELQWENNSPLTALWPKPRCGYRDFNTPLGEVQKRNPDEVDIHYVGLYEGSTKERRMHTPGCDPEGLVTLKIDTSRKPLVIVLSAYDYVRWQFELDPGVQVDQVIVLGRHMQSVAGLPSTTSVVYRDLDSGNFVDYAHEEGDKFDNIREYLRETLGFNELTSTQFAYSRELVEIN